MELLRTPIAGETAGGAVAPEVAKAKGQTLRLSGQMIDMVAPDQLPKLPTPRAQEPGSTSPGYGDSLNDIANRVVNGHARKDLLPTTRTSMANGPTQKEIYAGNPKSRLETVTNWGKFEPAIKRWEQVIERKAPAPTKPDGKDGNHRLSSKFTEWMMGLPEGWITDVGLTRNEELKACGNGVVPQQAELALRILLQDIPFESTGGASEFTHPNS